MDTRKQIGLFLFYDERWVAGSYYIINLIESLKLLPDAEKPHLTIIGRTEEDTNKAREIQYPYVSFASIEEHRHHLLKRACRVLVRRLMGKEIFKPTLNRSYKKSHFDALFPCPLLFEDRLAKKIMYWIPDFQEEYLPQFFTQKDIALRKSNQQKMAATNHTIVLSSHDALKDYEKLYPSATAKGRVLNFAVIHPPYAMLDFSEIMAKYKIPSSYFFCPNQFWAHKNHKIVLQALQKLKDEYRSTVHVVFSGKEYDYRNPSFFTELNKLIDELRVRDNISLLGFIDRVDQLAIMKNAMAVIQPSLFEGWSTVVEDAKSMNQNLIVSDIAVHREQLKGKGIFFDPYQVDSLVRAIVSFQKKELDFQYSNLQEQFGRNFLNIVSE